MPRFDLPLDELRTHRPEVAEPDDFDDFWAMTLAEARDAAGGVEVSDPDPTFTTVAVHDVRFPGFGGEPIAAWLLLPRDAVPRAGVVEFIGYNGGRGLPHERLAWASAGYAHLVMDTRGQGSGWSRGVTDDSGPTGPAVPGVMTRGIDDPHRYYYRRLFTDAARAVDALRGLDIVAPDRVAVAGGSQGGGISLAAAGILGDVAAVMPDVPFLCHFARAVGMTSAHPYREIDDYLRIHRDAVDGVFRTLSYVDGVNFARRITAPGLFSAALQDEICPPSTVFAAANAYAGEREIDVYPYNGHEGGGAERWPRQESWLRGVLG